MADVSANLKDWSATASSNNPAGGTTIGTGLDDNLREIQKVVRQDLATKGADIAASATTDIGAVAGFFHDITGASTVTNLGTVSAGIWKVLKFESTPVIVHNATSLILLTGANRTTANGDVGIYVSEGSGNWRELSFFPVTGGSYIAPTLIDAAGDLIQGSAADTAARLAIGALGTRLHSTGTLAEWQATWFKVGTFTRDTSLASGTQAVTGVGFTPKAVIFFAAVDTTSRFSVGFDDGTNSYLITDREGIAAATWRVLSTFSIEMVTNGSDIYQGEITTLGTDGFTITWTKIGTPTGTATIFYLALR